MMTQSTLDLHLHRRRFLREVPAGTARACLPGCGGRSSGIGDADLDARLRAMEADFQKAWQEAFATTATFTETSGPRGLKISVVNNRLRVSRVQTYACNVYIHAQKVNYSTL